MELDKFNNILFFNKNNSSKESICIKENKNNLDDKYLKIEQKHDEKQSLNNEEKYKNYDNAHKKIIFEKNYGQKISLYSQSNQPTTSKSKNKKNIIVDRKKDLSLEEYLEELKRKYDEDPIYFESMDKSNNKYYYRFSGCFFCHNLAFAYKDKVTCLNKCFTMDVQTNEFNDDYTLDNFLESHYEFYYDHIECNANIIPIYIDEKRKEPYFICYSCDKEILKKAGIII